MSQDKFIIHAWEKDKMDALVKHNEMEAAKAEGKNIGIKENTLEIAQNMLKKGMDLEDISEVTGLTKEEIQKLQNTEDK